MKCGPWDVWGKDSHRPDQHVEPHNVGGGASHTFAHLLALCFENLLNCSMCELSFKTALYARPCESSPPIRSFRCGDSASGVGSDRGPALSADQSAELYHLLALQCLVSVIISAAFMVSKAVGNGGGGLHPNKGTRTARVFILTVQTRWQSRRLPQKAPYRAGTRAARGPSPCA